MSSLNSGGSALQLAGGTAEHAAEHGSLLATKAPAAVACCQTVHVQWHATFPGLNMNSWLAICLIAVWLASAPSVSPAGRCR